MAGFALLFTTPTRLQPHYTPAVSLTTLGNDDDPRA